ncbi:hypothetical protein MAUB_32810 [Mycolicibacterium aubagnense]|uniref:Uncharacterized protein n=1 Tax=Mycolicibacterium aubagnense TaxID=319707 RepID=A0ABM7IF21_9MYCO|nr:hypothetical protein MAUB_32810 [Mycolicibacterium aubagnense]
MSDVRRRVGAGFVNSAAGAEVQDSVHSDNPFGSFFVWTLCRQWHPYWGAVINGTHVTIETNIDNALSAQDMPDGSVVRPGRRVIR